MSLSHRARPGVALLVMAALLLGACSSFTGSAQVSELETRNAQLQATIDVIGTPAATIVALQMTADRALVMQAEMNSIQGTALAVQSTLTALQLGGGALVAQPTPQAPAIQGTPLSGGQQPAGAITPAPGSSDAPTTFSQTTTATGVREADGCAAGATSIFEATEDEIYVVTTISNLKAGAVFGARWLANGALFHDDPRCWIPAQDWASVCAWCSIVPDGGRFEPGNWTVELTLNGQLLSQAQFQVVDSSAATPGGEVTAP